MCFELGRDPQSTPDELWFVGFLFFGQASGDRERSVKTGEADNFCSGDVRPVLLSFRDEEVSARCITGPFFDPFTRKHVNGFIGEGVGVSWNCSACFELSENGHSSGLLVFAEDE